SVHFGDLLNQSFDSDNLEAFNILDFENFAEADESGYYSSDQSQEAIDRSDQVLNPDAVIVRMNLDREVVHRTPDTAMVFMSPGSANSSHESGYEQLVHMNPDTAIICTYPVMVA
ncbi:hypothetical protein LOAG_10940, partial [Loa loa]